MPYRYNEHIATSDAAFEVWANDIETLFRDAADALINIMIENPPDIQDKQQLVIRNDDISIEMLLFTVLQELIFLKDSKRLLCRLKDVSIGFSENTVHFSGTVYGEPIDTGRHKLLVDVKAVTLHNYSVKKKNNLWRAQIVVDI